MTMRTALGIFSGAAILVINASAASAGAHTGEIYLARELMQTCVEADNDSRFGKELEIECEQYISGFVQALEQTGQVGADAGICPPDENMPDEVRWAFTRWVHGSYTKRVQLSAAEAMLATLRDEFPCGG